MIYKQNVDIGPLTTLGLGGPARHFFTVSTAKEAKKALVFAQKEARPVFVLGEGSNILVSDNGFRGVVIKNEIKGIDFISPAIVKVGAGENWDSFVGLTIKKGLAGLECLSGIPGTVGASPIQNIGAYGQEAADTIEGVEVIEFKNSRPRKFLPQECNFGYRKSIFNTTDKEKFIITAVIFKLKKGDKQTLKKKREEIIEIRRQKGHLAPPLGPQSVGSFFKNPVVSVKTFEKIRKTIKEEGWYWSVKNEVKISAAKLIEKAGFRKGMRQGRVGISPFHSLALVNYGNGRAVELFKFSEKIKRAVKDRFGIQLEREVKLIGFNLPKLKK